MQRREASRYLIGAALAGSASLAALALRPARAQGGPVADTNYLRLARPVATAAPAGHIEVIEFFWYGCPHCNAFEPALEAWVRRLPKDIVFRRVPVAFNSAAAPHQRIFYALESLGLVATLHRKVFDAIHQDHLRLDQLPQITAFMAKNGVDSARFTAAYSSFSVQSQVRQADQLATAYRLDAVPSLGIGGLFYTTGALAGSNERMLAVADFLTQRLRSGG
ncbi:MAG: thiol:disulfide interchange protein DsbA/DsbL [Burkholderiaceae bacterium]